MLSAGSFRRVAVILCVMAVAGVTSCTKNTGVHPETAAPEPTPSAVPADFLKITRGDLGDSGVKHVSKLDPHRALLTGPHSVLQLDAVAHCDRLTGVQAEDLDLTGSGDVGVGPVGLRPPAGYEFVLAHLPSTSAEPALPFGTGDTQGAAGARLVVDGKVRTLPADASLLDSTIVVSVKKDAPALLEMTDGKRKQDLDLRTGKRTRAASPLLYPVRVADLEDFDSVDYRFSQSDGATVTASVDHDPVLTPYVDKIGWAHHRRAWLLVTIALVVTPEGDGFTPDDQTLTCTLAGKTISGRAGYGKGAFVVGGDQLSAGTLMMVFDVPDTTRGVTLNYLPTGTFTTDDHQTVSASPMTGMQHTRISFAPRKPA